MIVLCDFFVRESKDHQGKICGNYIIENRREKSGSGDTK